MNIKLFDPLISIDLCYYSITLPSVECGVATPVFAMSSSTTVCHISFGGLFWKI